MCVRACMLACVRVCMRVCVLCLHCTCECMRVCEHTWMDQNPEQSLRWNSNDKIINLFANNYWSHYLMVILTITFFLTEKYPCSQQSGFSADWFIGHLKTAICLRAEHILSHCCHDRLALKSIVRFKIDVPWNICWTSIDPAVYISWLFIALLCQHVIYCVPLFLLLEL